MKQKWSNKQDLLKLIGILAMTIDHIAWVFFPQVVFFHAIGRLAMPIFSASIAFGYRKTSNFKKYLFLLIVFGLISQIPFSLLWVNDWFNIVLSLALSLIFIYWVDNKHYLLAIGALGVSIVFPFEFGWVLPVMTLIFFKFRNDKKLAFSLLVALNIVYVFQIKVPYQIFSIISFYLILFMPEIKRSFRLNKFIFYFFYPAHLLVLYLLLKFI